MLRGGDGGEVGEMGGFSAGWVGLIDHGGIGLAMIDWLWWLL